jgi:hypothetical protein
MESKWPFMLITFGLLFALGLTISNIERSSVMNNWDKRRCEFPVMASGMFFKPDWDPRSKNEFAKDNFSFCMKGYVDKFIQIFMTPINYIFGKQLNVAGSAIDMINTIRNIAQSLYNTFLSFLDHYWRQFNASVFEMSRIIQYLRMAMRRLNAMMVNMIYMGITIFRGMINTIQFVIKVILIICGILLGIIIILIFILFPFIPMILSVLGAIIAVVLVFTMVIAGQMGDALEAEDDRGGFCFSKYTKILVKSNGKNIFKNVSEVKVGDELGGNCGKVTAVIEMSGKDVPLYNLKGIYVSGTHLVKGEDGIWKSVSQDPRSNKTENQSDILYCFNTTSHNIPVFSPELTSETAEKSVIVFRDWEEISDDDEKGQYTWNYLILKKLNNLSNYSKWKNGLKVSSDMPLMGNNMKVKTSRGFVDISKLNMDDKVLDRDNKEQSILGVINGLIENAEDGDGEWNTELYEFGNDVWIKGKSTVLSGSNSIKGKTIITETGEFIIWDSNEKKEKIVRDFTDIGHKSIHETYPFVAARLRVTEQVR